jgi:hypothetical protein
VLKHNKDDAKENDGGKANYELLAIPIKQGFPSPLWRQSLGDPVFRSTKKTATRRPRKAV